MDCKEALAASDGDFEKAIDFLRKKGLLCGNQEIVQSGQRRNGFFLHTHGR